LCFQKIDVEYIFTDSKYIFVSYEGKYIFKGNIWCKYILRWRREKKKKKCIFNVISIPNLWVIFLYKYISCIIWNIERVENKGLEANNKTRVCRVFSWQQTLTRVGIESPLIHLGETLLGYSLLVTGRDSGLWVALGKGFGTLGSIRFED
jgi:hypothetical protein